MVCESVVGRARIAGRDATLRTTLRPGRREVARGRGAEITLLILMVLGQGDFAEHIDTFKKCENVECREIRKTEVYPSHPSAHSPPIFLRLESFALLLLVRRFPRLFILDSHPQCRENGKDC